MGCDDAEQFFTSCASIGQVFRIILSKVCQESGICSASTDVTDAHQRTPLMRINPPRSSTAGDARTPSHRTTPHHAKPLSLPLSDSIVPSLPAKIKAKERKFLRGGRVIPRNLRRQCRASRAKSRGTFPPCANGGRVVQYTPLWKRRLMHSRPRSQKCSISLSTRCIQRRKSSFGN